MHHVIGPINEAHRRQWSWGTEMWNAGYAKEGEQATLLAGWLMKWQKSSDVRKRPALYIVFKKVENVRLDIFKEFSVVEVTELILI